MLKNSELEECYNKLANQVQNDNLVSGLYDLNGCFVAVSPLQAMLTGFEHPKELVGLKNKDLQCELSAYAAFFEKQIELVKTTRKRIKYIGMTKKYSNKKPTVFCYEQFPVSHLGQLVGVMFRGQHFSEQEIKKLCRFLYLYPNEKEQLLNIDDYTKNIKLYEHLSEKEKECLFFYLRGYTSKQIANLFERSARTIESRIRNIYKKMSCVNKSQLIEVAIEQGIFFSIPHSLFAKDFIIRNEVSTSPVMLSGEFV